MTGKTRDRPRFPESYGIESSPEGMLDWPPVETALREAAIYWVATAGDGPHITPIWGAWAADRLYLEGGSTTRWARNLAADPRASVGVDVSRLQVLVEGLVVTVEPDPPLHEAIASQYASKYPYRPDPGSMFELRPRKVLAWSVATIDAFASTPTRFRFEEDE